MINERTINDLLKNIRNKVPSLRWDLVCRYHNGNELAIMELRLYKVSMTRNIGRFTYHNPTGKIIRGRYGEKLRFNNQSNMLDALLDILSLELNRMNSKIV